MPNPTVFGQTVSLTANVVALGPGTPTGTVTFNISGGPTLTAPLVGGKATTATAGLTAGPHLVTATYSGNGTFSSSTGSTIQAVVQAGTRTTLTTSPNPSQPGQPVTLTATVAAVPPGAGTPTGNVTFYVVGGPILTAPLVGGQAAATTTALGTGPRTIVATYTGDPNFFPSADTGIHTSLPGRTASTTTVSPSPNPSVPGQAVTFTATVAPAGPGGGTPTGTVTFTISGGPTLTAPVVAGRATVTTSALTPGPHTVTAQYSGDGAFNPSTGTMTQTVDRASTTTTVTSSPDPSVAGQSVTLTANVAPVAPGSGTPTGTVTFVIDGGAPMTAPLVGGQASVSTSALGVGSHTVTATYGGDASFAPSTGNDTQTVQAQPVTATTTAVTSSPDPSVVGQAVTFAATVAPVDPGSGTPTGSVTFDFGDGTAAVTVALSGGTATVAHTYAAAGSPYLVRASYSGSATFSSSIGIDPHTVQPRTATATRTTVTSSPDPSAAGQSVTFTANVSPVAPGTGAPTRTVIFDFGDGSTATVALSGSSATITHAYASAAGSPYQVRATYSGSPVFGPSTGTDTQSVTRVSTTTTVTSSPDPSVAGQPVTFTATVAPVAPGTGTPTGTVTFAFGDGSTGTGTLSGGTATVTHAYVSSTGSPFTVTATYGGSAAFASSTGSDSQTVSRVSTTTVVSSAPDPSV
ncbi:Ig-like domain repeat protein, partial [Streptomyces sp. NPDC048639]|uniref:Ig-like domain repeat protein n=1 Tax=Streptomyces sp. NPDC048639 TaxID=3365581 RepID=UPI003713A710